ncbi:MAG TPA: hypothetical protein VFN13_10995 [Rudaea sp.]|nr:hypothetical protein [Rudaea sp.]
MHTRYGIVALALLGGMVAACSQRSPATASSPAEPAVAAATRATPCDLLTDAEVRSVFPSAGSGKRNTQSLQYGLDRCAWKAPDGQIGIEVSKVEAKDFEGELRAELQGAVDPRVQGALARIRFQPVSGIGDHAIAVLENGDTKRGIYTDISLLAIQRDHRMAVLMIHHANADAPLPTLDTLKTLGGALASRL